MRRLASFVAALLFAISPVAAADGSPKARAERVLSQAPYQTDLPDNPAHRRRIETSSLDPSFERVLVALGYVALIVGVGAFAYALIRRVGESRPRAHGSGAQPEPLSPRDPPAADAVGPTLEDADRLAAEGRFREAVHTLLLVAIGETVRLTASSFPPSATGRELARLLPLDGERLDGFGDLVRAVERSVFGGRDAGADEYAVCRARCLLVSGRIAA